MSALLALLSSLMFGTTDYIGGHLSKKYKVFAVAASTQFFGFFVGATLLLLTHTWQAPSLSWSGYFLPGIFAGTIGFIGLNTFFAGLSTGKMGVISPISSLSVLVPVIYSLAHGENPSMRAAIGMAIAILGAFFGSGPEIRGGLSAKPLFLGIVTAVCFGVAILLLTIGAKSSVLLTSVTMRIPALILILFLMIKTRSVGGLKKNILWLLVISGAGDILANVTLAKSSTMGSVSAAVVLSSMYPVITAMLAFRFSHERLHKLQYLGIIFAIAGVSLISLG